MIPKSVTRYIDIAFCLVLLPAMVMLLPIDRWLERDPQFIIMLLVWLYANYLLMRKLIIPYILGARREGVVAILLIILTLTVTYLLTRYQLSAPIQPRVMSQEESEHFIQRAASGSGRMQRQAVWFLYVVVTTFSFAVSLLSELNKQIVSRQAVEHERRRAELSLYKAQINPHFLFNTLNTLLGLVVTKSDRAEDAIVQFTSLMRYMSSSSTQEYVPLHTEVEYIEEYIALQRYRLSEHTNIEFNTSFDGEIAGCKIAPMLLITFVENALKYGSSSQFASDILIDMDLHDTTLTLKTHNPVFESQRSKKGDGIGIENCRKRLELLYPHAYSLKIVDSGESYEAMLTIDLV